jgi:polyribonucleotide nucleotidyltransferase
MIHTVERQIGQGNLTIETGKLAAQADAAVTVRYGDTLLIATVCAVPPSRELDFFPFTIDYEERLYAAGRIPGSFFRREGRPTQEAILTARLTDRPLRPLFPKGYKEEVQVVITVMSVDTDNPPEVLAIIGASAALSLSDIPFGGPVGATRICHIDGDYILHPTYAQIAQSDLSMVVAGTRDAVMMVEAGSNEVSEEIVLEAIRLAQEANTWVVDIIEELVAATGKPKRDISQGETPIGLEDRITSLLDGRLLQVFEANGDKPDQEAAIASLKDEVVESLAEEFPQAKAVEAVFEAISKQTVRDRILGRGKRPDGRGATDIRQITCEVGLLPRTHGSGLFSRGITQVLSIATLAPPSMEQKLDALGPNQTKRFMHHYNFPGYSVGDVRRVGSPGRREIGHGALAERAILPSLPGPEDFSYAIRVVSEVMSSNGSTSMASVCASTLALMDAGVPIKSPVAGLAMGLVMGEDGKYAILSDIQGVEDHLGDMDFKVAGTARGINALQMDIKVKGLTQEVLAKALAQAKDGRLFILSQMAAAMPGPRDQVSAYAPKIVRISIPIEKIGSLIGPGGKNIRAIQQETGATVDVDDKGNVYIGAIEQSNIDRARDRVDGLTRELAVGDVFTGKVARVTSFGAFVELTAGKDGLLRQSELGDDMEDGLKVGQELTVKILEIDAMGRVNLSRRALLGEEPSSRNQGSESSESQPKRFPSADSRGPRPEGGPGRTFRPGDGGQRRPPSAPPRYPR